MKEQYELKVECIFCNSTEFEIPYEGYKPEEGEMIKCSNCGRLNAFSSIRDVAVNEKMEEIKEDIKGELKKIFKKSGWKIK